MKFGKLRVDIIYKNGNKMFYENISRIVPMGRGTHKQNIVLIHQDLSDEEMEDFGLDPNEDNNWINIEIDMNNVTEFKVTTHLSDIY